MSPFTNPCKNGHNTNYELRNGWWCCPRCGTRIYKDSGGKK